ncbi:MAG: sulfatase [Blastomonas sp.]
MKGLFLRAAASAVTLLACAGQIAPATGLAQSAPAKQAEAEQQSHRPNVLFIIADDLNTRVSPYGGPALTPNILRLASQGVTFDRAYSQFPWCGPSRASFLTGTRPDTNGVMDLTTPVRSNLPDIITLPQYFRQNGYHTARVGKIFHQGVPGGVGRDGLDDPQSWDERYNPVGCDAGSLDKVTSLTPGIPLGGALSYMIDECGDAQQTDGIVADKAIALLRAAAESGKPFFLATGFYRPHVPEIVPKAYFALYPTDQVKVAGNSADHLAKMVPAAKAISPDHYGMSPDEQRAFTRSYYAATSFMDAQVGRVLQAVDELGLADDTIIVFTSDHGYLLGEHGQWQKQLLFEESARVPLIIRVPGTRQAGKRSPRTVEMLDLYPTLAELAGLPRYRRNEGSSLVRLLAQPDDARWAKPALSQVNGGRSVRTERYRYTEWEGGKSGRELYDHASDPGEQVNLAEDPRYAAIVDLLRAMLPAGPVEPLPSRAQYDPRADCLVPSSRYKSGSARQAGANPGQDRNGASDGIVGLKLCDLAE